MGNEPVEAGNMRSSPRPSSGHSEASPDLEVIGERAVSSSTDVKLLFRTE